MRFRQGSISKSLNELNMAYAVITTIEQFLEMVGVVIFIYTLLLYVSSYMKGVALRIKMIDDRRQRQSA